MEAQKENDPFLANRNGDNAGVKKQLAGGVYDRPWRLAVGAKLPINTF